MRINKFYTHILGISLLIVSLISYSCTQHDFISNNSTDHDHILLDLSVEVSGTNSKSRSISSSSEEKIKQINVLVFTKSDDSAEELFSYVAEIKENSERSILVNLKKTKGTETARLVIIANQDISSQNFTDMTKKEVLEMITFDSDGKWNTESDNDFRALPMWGESETKAISLNTVFNTVSLLRSLARIDIFINTNNPETANYNLREVYLYRSLNQGFVAPDESTYSDQKVSEPTVPESATQNERIDYKSLTDPKQLVRTIYTPENFGLAQDECTTIVVGISGSESTASISYYRLDILDSDSKKSIALLRNHRYLMNIKRINGKGSDTEDEALNAGPSNIEWDVIEWDENTIGAHISGNYYLGVDRQEVSFYYQEETSIDVTLKTNIPENQLQLFWDDKDQEDFEYSFDYEKGIITFKVIIKDEPDPDPDPDEPGDDEDEQETVSRKLKINSDSISAFEARQFLHIKSGGIDLKIKIEEDKKKQPYEIICSTIIQSGSIRQGIPLDDSNTITLTLRSNTDDIIGYRYEVYTPEVGGISFRAEGIFDSRIQNITLKGSGTPTIEGKITLPFILNSSLLNGCGITVNSTFSGIRILPIGKINNKSGYAAQSSASRAILRAKQNFGNSDDSKVKVDGFEIMPFLQTKSGGFLDHQSLELDLDKSPDILILGHYVSFDEFTNQKFKEYLEKGGIMILFQESSSHRMDESVFAFFQYLWPSSKLNSSRIYSGGKCYPINNIDDMITNGVFGDVRLKYWGEDASSTLAISGIPANDIEVYATSTANAKKVVMFKHKKYNLFWVGDGGFLSNNNTHIGPGNNSSTRPFTIDADYNPIPNTKYSKPVYNSTIFANLIAWAVSLIDQGKGINKPEAR